MTNNIELDNWLETAMIDLALCKIKYAAYSYEYMWAKYIREN